MPQLSKKDIKETFIKSLEPFARSIQRDFQKVDKRLDSIDGQLINVDKRLGNVEGQLINVDERLGNVEQDVKWMKENSSELFTKLDRFISLYEKQEQELTALAAQLERLEERVNKLESNSGH